MNAHSTIGGPSNGLREIYCFVFRGFFFRKESSSRERLFCRSSREFGELKNRKATQTLSCPSQYRHSRLAIRADWVKSKSDFFLCVCGIFDDILLLTGELSYIMIILLTGYEP